ncbi:MAG TPA: non-ribosomal peptide synthetase [Vicinamibacterales bacterium]|nr:non-ribosomal peptide synthetase [Vicinamibacterales bacterium]
MIVTERAIFRPVHAWVGDVAGRRGDSVAIEQGGERVTYAELDRRAWTLANALRAAGLPRHGMVVVLTGTSADAIVAILGVLRAGGIFVPLDPRSPRRHLDTLVGEVDAKYFVTSGDAASLAAAIAGPDRVVTAVDRLTGSAAPFDLARDPDDACYVYFTSGSTGRPKGILGRLKAIDQFIRWEIDAFRFGDGLRVSQLITPSFDAFLRDVFVPLCAGGTVCVPESPDLKLDAPRLAAWLDAARINLVHCVPSLFRTLLNEPLRPEQFAALTHVLLSGEPLLPADVKRWFDVFGPRVQLVNLYGPSETTMVKFFHRVQPADQSRASVPIGRPMAGTTAILVDRRGRPVPRGLVGEIYIRTPYRSLGYLGQAPAGDRFVQNPFGSDPADIVYRTGDLGRVLADGSFELRGRRDQQVKIRGERIELAAIENVLRTCPDVRDVAVIDRDDAAGTKYLCAFVVAPQTIDVADLRARLAAELPPSMVPGVFVRMDRLPRTTSGKIDRAQLPATARVAADRPVSEPPRTDLERRVGAMFAEVLGVPAVGVRDSFFELGGHSLLATQLISRVRAAFQVDLPVRSLFEAPTVAGIAQRVDMLQWAAAAPVADAAAPAKEFEL